MIHLRRATCQDFDLILPLLSGFNNASMTPDRWKKLFYQEWAKEDFVGFVLVDNDEAVGFMGIVFSSRIIGDVEHKFCNLNSWIVKEKYRSTIHSASIVNEVMKLTDYTITSFTSTPQARKILVKNGLSVFEEKLAHIFPCHKYGQNISIYEDEKDIFEKLNDHEKIIYNDHKRFNCCKFLIEDHDSYCLLIVKNQQFQKRKYIIDRINNYLDLIIRTIIRKSLLNKVENFAQVYYISNRNFFMKYQDEIAALLSDVMKTIGMACDGRHVSGRIKSRVLYSDCVKALYRSPTLSPEQIDSIYSEIFVFDS